MAGFPKSPGRLCGCSRQRLPASPSGTLFLGRFLLLLTLTSSRSYPAQKPPCHGCNLHVMSLAQSTVHPLPPTPAHHLPLPALRKMVSGIILSTILPLVCPERKSEIRNQQKKGWGKAAGAGGKLQLHPSFGTSQILGWASLPLRGPHCHGNSPAVDQSPSLPPHLPRGSHLL